MAGNSGLRARRFANSAGKISPASRYRGRPASRLPGKARQRAATETSSWARLTAVVSSFTAIVALVFTGLSLQATREQIAIAAQGEVTGRFTSAVDQLGNSSPDVRTGAIFALGSIAHDSAYEQPAIIELLSDFIRRHSGESGSCDPQLPAATDVEAALTVLSERDSTQDGQATIDLAGACLDHDDLDGMIASRADLNGACLIGASLADANLTDADLTDADFADAILSGARLAGARLNAATFEGANLEHAYLDNVVLGYTTFTNALLKGASLAPYPDATAFLEDCQPSGQVQPAAYDCAQLSVIRSREASCQSLRDGSTGNHPPGGTRASRGVTTGIAMSVPLKRGIMENSEASTAAGVPSRDTVESQSRYQHVLSGQRCPGRGFWIPDEDDSAAEFYNENQKMRYGPNGKTLTWTGPYEKPPGFGER